MGQYDVKGYEGNPGYDGPYHPSAELNPDIKFVHGGDPEAAGKLEAEAFARAKEFRKEREKQKEEALESWEIEQGKTAVVQDSKDEAYADFTAPGTYQPPVTTEGKTFVEEQKQTAKQGEQTTERAVDNDASARSSSTSGSNSSSSSSTSVSRPAVKKAAAKKTASKKPTAS